MLPRCDFADIRAARSMLLAAVVMKRIITPAMFLSAQIVAGTATRIVLDDESHDDDVPRDDIEVLAKAPASNHDSWWVLHTVGRGCVVLHN